MTISRAWSRAAAALAIMAGLSGGVAARPAEPIGMAWLEPDGTLVLMLRAQDGAGTVGDGMLRYPPRHPDYATLRRHVGPLAVGERVPVSSFPMPATQSAK